MRLTRPRRSATSARRTSCRASTTDAVSAYDQVIKKYKTVDSSDAVPDAYYKQGVSFEQLKQRDQAIANYQLLRKEYPNSNAALQASQDLKRLGILK